MGKHAVTLIPGDGVGPEICAASLRVLEATGVEFEWDVQHAGEAAIAEFGTPLPDHVLDSVRKNKVALKGPITTPVGSGFRSVNVALRQALDLYALVRPVKAYKGARNLRDDLDFTDARSEGRERAGSRTSRGRRGRGFRRAVCGIPAGKFRDRLVQMTANAGLHVVVVDPAYSSRWGAQH